MTSDRDDDFAAGDARREREVRLAAALRANLRRRKAQARRRAEGDAAGVPAAANRPRDAAGAPLEGEGDGRYKGGGADPDRSAER